MLTEKEKKERFKKLDLEIGEWINAIPNDTLSRLRRFYDSIISIHLGGDGIMGRHRSLMNKGASYQEVKANWRNYKLNYPGKDENLELLDVNGEVIGTNFKINNS